MWLGRSEHRIGVKSIAQAWTELKLGMWWLQQDCDGDNGEDDA